MDVHLYYLLVVDASQRFYDGTTKIQKIKKLSETPEQVNIEPEFYETKTLKEVVDPEEKRKIIGDTFVHVAEKEIQELGLGVDEVFLGKIIITHFLWISGSNFLF